MFDCMIMGDSIAVATHQLKPGCVSYSQSGISSTGWSKRYIMNDLKAGVVIISLGSNDISGRDYTYGNLMAIRGKIKASKVYWIAPNPEVKPKEYQDVNLIAGTFNDEVLLPKQYQKDKIHPSTAGYKELIDRVKF